MQESSNFNFPLIPTTGFVKYIDALFKEGKRAHYPQFASAAPIVTWDGRLCAWFSRSGCVMEFAGEKSRVVCAYGPARTESRWALSYGCGRD